MSKWGEPDHVQIRPNSRNGGGYSLRRSLYDQGVNDELEINRHLNSVYSTLTAYPKLDITIYRVNQRLPLGAVALELSRA